MEVIQGESGVHPVPDDALHAAREACDAVGAALIFDEIQTGLARTGTLWAYEQTGVVPDAMTTAKALGGGLPIGALITGERLREVLQPGDHGSTFAGGPLVAAAAQRRARRPRGPGAPRARPRARRAAARGPRRAAAASPPSAAAGSWSRSTSTASPARLVAPRAARAAPGRQRHRPADRPAAPAARRRRGARSTTPSAACARSSSAGPCRTASCGARGRRTSARRQLASCTPRRSPASGTLQPVTRSRPGVCRAAEHDLGAGLRALELRCAAARRRAARELDPGTSELGRKRRSSGCTRDRRLEPAGGGDDELRPGCR